MLYVFSEDTEKAFCFVEWSYLFCALNKCSLGDNFIRRIRILYDNPQATILTNGFKSDGFKAYRGTRPPLLAIAIELPAEAIRTSWSIAGLQVGDVHHKISLYTEKVLKFISKPEMSALT